VKTIHLHRGALSSEAISAMATATLKAGGRVEPNAPEPSEPAVGAVIKDDARRGNDRAAHADEPPIGAVMKDGTIYAGISPDTGNPMYAAAADAPLAMTFNEAADYAAKLEAHGHKDWHVPTRAELKVLYNNRAAIGGFNLTGSYPPGWYWSSTQHHKGSAWCQRFSDGARNDIYKYVHSSVRPVR
jgi:hypothetical protein